MAVVEINYDEGNKKKLGYKSVSISYDNLKKEKVFDSGNFVKDWFDYIKWVIQNGINKNEPVVCSSSVDHFIMDGAPYDSAFLKVEKNKTSLVYKYDDDFIELFVPKGTRPTWTELKEMCK
jgi:hypothetical protein